MGVLPEGGRGGEGKENGRTDGVGVRSGSKGVGEMRPIEEDQGAEAEVGVAKTTMTATQTEAIKIEVTWKISEFAEKMRVQDTVTFSKELDLERHVDTRAGYESSLLHALLHPRLSLTATFSSAHLNVKGGVGGVAGVGNVVKTGVGDGVDTDVRTEVETFLLHEAGHRKKIVNGKVEYEFLLNPDGEIAFLWAHKDAVTLGVAASMTFNNSEEWALWDHGTYRLDNPTFDLRMRKTNRIECMNILANVLSAMPTDIVMRVGRKCVSAHKAVLGEHSRVIAAMMRANPRFSELEIEDVSLAAVKEFKIFCYTGEVPNVAALGEELLLFCDSYDIDTMARAVDAFLVRALIVGTVVRTLLLADCHKRQDLRNRCIAFVQANHAAVYQTESWKKLKEFSTELYEEVVEKVSQAALAKEKAKPTAERVVVIPEPNPEIKNASPAGQIEPKVEASVPKPQPTEIPRMPIPQQPQQIRMPMHPQMMQMFPQHFMQFSPMMQYPQMMAQAQMMQNQQMMHNQQIMQNAQLLQGQVGPNIPPGQSAQENNQTPGFNSMPTSMGMPFSHTGQATFNQFGAPQNISGSTENLYHNSQFSNMQHSQFMSQYHPQMSSSMTSSFMQPNGQPQSEDGLSTMPTSSMGQSIYAGAEMNKLLESLPPIPDITETFGPNQQMNPTVDSINKIMEEHEKFMTSLSQPAARSQQTASSLAAAEVPLAELADAKIEELEEEDALIEEIAVDKPPVAAINAAESNSDTKQDKPSEPTVLSDPEKSLEPETLVEKHESARQEKTVTQDLETAPEKNVTIVTDPKTAKDTVQAANGSESQPGKTRTTTTIEMEENDGVEEQEEAEMVRKALSEPNEATGMEKSDKMKELMKKNEKWKKRIDSMSEDVEGDSVDKTEDSLKSLSASNREENSDKTAFDSNPKDTADQSSNAAPKSKAREAISKNPSAATNAEDEKHSKASLETSSKTDDDESWEKVATTVVKEKEEDEWQKVTPLKKADDDDDEHWEKVTTLRVFGKKEKMKQKSSVALEDKWDNVNSEMKKVVLNRREKDDDGEWEKVATAYVEEDIEELDTDKWMKLADLEVNAASAPLGQKENKRDLASDIHTAVEVEQRRLPRHRSGEQWENVLDMIMQEKLEEKRFKPHQVDEECKIDQEPELVEESPIECDQVGSKVQLVVDVVEDAAVEAEAEAPAFSTVLVETPSESGVECEDSVSAMTETQSECSLRQEDDREWESDKWIDERRKRMVRESVERSMRTLREVEREPDIILTFDNPASDDNDTEWYQRRQKKKQEERARLLAKNAARRK